MKKISEVGLQNIGKTAEQLLGVVKQNTCELLEAILEANDAAIVKVKANGLKV